MTVDEHEVQAAADKVFGELGVAITGPLIALGDRLGLRAQEEEAPFNIVLEARS